MDTIGLNGQGDIGAGVNKKSSRRLRITARKSCLPDCAYYFFSQQLQIARGQVFLAQLNVVDACTRGFGDFFNEPSTA